MTRVFLKLYLLIVLPLVLMTLLPKSPLSILGEWWFEKETFRQYGAIYPLVKEELDLIPQSQWVEKVESIGEHFSYLLLLKSRDSTNLNEDTYSKLNSKGHALIRYKGNRTLVFTVEASNYILYVSLYNNVSNNLEEFEKDTRGFRYFLNKKIIESKDPFAEFEKIKHYFSMPLRLIRYEDFQQSQINKDVVFALQQHKLFIDNSDKANIAYLLSEDKKYLVEIKGTNARATYRKYYQYLSFLVPAILLAIGAILWLLLFRREFKKVNLAAKDLGDGQLNTRIELSRHSALYPIADSFNDMATRIEALLEGHKDLTNAISHELKTPLSRLHFALEMQKNSKTEEERETYTNKIDNNILALDGLVSELLSYTRLQRHYILELKHYSLKVWLEEEIAIFSDYHKNIDIRLKIETIQEVAFDKHLMSRALNNLLDNAANYVNQNNPIIRLVAKQIKNTISLSVEDNGKGLSPTDYQTVFDPFTRLDKSRQRTKTGNLGGYGMGLAIVKSILKQHKGSVSCGKSGLGGAAFELIWPK